MLRRASPRVSGSAGAPGEASAKTKSARRPLWHRPHTWLALAALIGLGTAARHAAAEPETLVILNGKATPVYFNDGDTFRALAGPFAGPSNRLAGFNTLESYGTVHRWKGWTYKELYVNAKMATLNSRRGVWHCEADMSRRDGYGRLLTICKDLQEDQIRKGLAHALSVDGPAEPRLIAAQRDAIVHRRGMWAKGAPAAILTSVHSVEERPDNVNNYNRLVSVVDGASLKWKHQDHYDECQSVCHEDKEVSRETALALIASMRRDPDTGRAIKGMEDPYLMLLLNEFATFGRVPQIFDEAGQRAVEHYLKEAEVRGDFGQVKTVEGACMVYVQWQRRFRYKPKCLKW